MNGDESTSVSGVFAHLLRNELGSTLSQLQSQVFVQYFVLPELNCVQPPSDGPASVVAEIFSSVTWSCSCRPHRAKLIAQIGHSNAPGSLEGRQRSFRSPTLSAWNTAERNRADRTQELNRTLSSQYISSHSRKRNGTSINSYA